ncbi:homocysteine S-methyltransferase family protein [Vallitalea sp.]|jgi:5-methyltetrahydrofolate--homocysteine methyltransferase|uniref:homocysteine S-methyltransferase family protein n=1 Tax=Vallitalea sp. TaxID=1882829 RepID=UPI0025E5539C|nr:homocysteine S-methyltransferase family protein [Vallitalea sp.]MCT4687213.1 homocysteine S-methyltransferase family protein [Vallitalea sp.]
MTKKEFKEYLQKNILILDGATGTELQKRGMPRGVCPEKWVIDNKEVIIDIQRGYKEAGSKAVYACTFGCNSIKLAEFGLEDKLVKMNKELVRISREAVGDDVWVVGDLSPTGAQIYPLSNYHFEDIVNAYKPQVKALVEAGVDLFVIETMMNINEARAALLAVKEICDLPVMVSMTYEKSGYTLNGTDPVTALITLQNLGADAVGCNCSTGPNDMIDIVKAMKPYAKVPLIVKPNAGLPKYENGKTIFDMDEDEFSHYGALLAEEGANIIGGCCGTTKTFISKLIDKMKDIDISLWKDRQGSILTSERKSVTIGGNNPTIIVGERINPTGKKKLQEHLRNKNMDYVVTLAHEQIEKGATVLDVNVGMNGIDEVVIMKQAIEQLSTFVKVPLCIDSSNIDAIEAGLRIYPGRALVNSISLEQHKIDKLLPIAKKYGAMFVLLPLSDKGLPKSINEKHEIINTIYSHAKELGYQKEDIIVDGLVTTIASNSKAAALTLETIEWCFREFGTGTIVGLSNISFGLPERKLINTAFLAMGIGKGLAMAIANPSNELLMNIMRASDVLAIKDKDSLAYIESFSKQEKKVKTKEIVSIDTNEEIDVKQVIFNMVVNGEKEAILDNIKKSIENGDLPKVIIKEYLIPAITKVGELFEEKTYFLPQLIMSAETMKAAMDYLDPLLEKDRDKKDKQKKKVVIATVKGDIHDIGKNLVALMLKNHGFEVIDLGKDVAKEVIVEKAKQVNADIIALSALMTTTMLEMENVIRLAKEEGLRAKVIIGGAVITNDYAREIGADGYSEDANMAVKLAHQLTN